MTIKKRLLLATIIISIPVSATFFMYHKSLVPTQMAAAISGLNENTLENPQESKTSGDIAFSEEAVSNIETKDTANVHNDSSSTIMIDTETKDKAPVSEIEVEKTYTNDHKVSSAISYKYDTNTVINDIQTLSNKARSEANLPSLAFDAKLAQLAIDRSTDMAKNNYLSHTALDGCDLECHFKNSGYETMTWGENLAEFEPYTTVSASDLAQELVKKWLQSSEHRRNLMSSEFTHEGIGVATSGKRIVVTVIFAKP
jgi:uncharacterized protein YkwD